MCIGQSIVLVKIATQNNITNAHSIVQTYMVTRYNNVKHDIDNFTEWYGQPLNCSKTFPVLNIVIAIIRWVNLPRPHHPDDWTAFDTEYRNINATQQTVMRTMVTTMIRLIHREEKNQTVSKGGCGRQCDSQKSNTRHRLRNLKKFAMSNTSKCLTVYYTRNTKCVVWIHILFPSKWIYQAPESQNLCKVQHKAVKRGLFVLAHTLTLHQYQYGNSSSTPNPTQPTSVPVV